MTESIWAKPKEGFMTLKEYNKLNTIAVEKQEEARKKDLKYNVENADELASRLKREQFKKYQKITQEPESAEASEVSNNYTTEDDINYQVLGKWESVDSSQPEKKPIDFELPKQNDVYYAVANVKPDEPPIKKFKEKIIVSLDADDVPSVFKKRKIGNRNIRKTNDDSI